MKKVILVFISFVVTTMLLAQGQSGLLLDNAAYERISKVVSASDGSKLGEASLKVKKMSLKEFAPEPVNQGKNGSCIGYAVGYSALTIMHTRRNGWTIPAMINKHALSGMYIYNQIKEKGDCSQGAYFPHAFDVLIQKGNIEYKEYEGKFQENSCYKTTKEFDEQAQEYKIENFERLFNADDNIENKRIQIKKSLSEGKPVVIGMPCRKSFYDFRGESDFYVPNRVEREEIVGYHAITVIGYDNQGFELMNSWGRDWGDGGFCKIKYSDFECNYAFHMILKPRWEGEVSSHTNNKDNVLQGVFDLRIPILDKEENLLGFDTLKTNFNGKYYELKQKNWQIGQFFQLVLNRMSSEKYLYVFSIDPKNKVKKHFPRDNENGMIAYNDISLVIPSEDGVLKKEVLGAEYLCVFCSNEIINEKELQLIEQKLGNPKIDVFQRIENALSNRLIPSEEIEYSSSQMKLLSNKKTSGIAPIILKIE